MMQGNIGAIAGVFFQRGYSHIYFGSTCFAYFRNIQISTEAYQTLSEPYQTPKMELSAKMVEG